MGITLISVVGFEVPVAGFEPAWDFSHPILRRMRQPIAPHRQRPTHHVIYLARWVGLGLLGWDVFAVCSSVGAVCGLCGFGVVVLSDSDFAGF